HRPLVTDTEVGLVEVPFEYPEHEPELLPAPARSWEDSEHIEEEEFTRAIALGLFDYLRKSRSRGFVVSASGGADSAATAILGALAVELAVAELGMDAALRRLAHIPGVEGTGGARALVRLLLLCVYQATRNSSDVTHDAARSVSEAIGAEFVRF